MADKKLYDNLYKVIKANSGAILANDTVLTEIMDLQIPRNYCARIRKVIFYDELNDQQPVEDNLSFYGALVLDPDDEDSNQIPTFAVDHDVLCDFHHEYTSLLGSEVGALGGSFVHNQRTLYEFHEDLDAVTVRNIRFNVLGNGLKVDVEDQPQVRCTVYFTYEKISVELYALLLGIS
ncbi:unnamed protein product [marine sediment metagenome]|uniref:Uncharacterized protein n=1 Tax=marine sediment metagenome TaxID=412755 RepID=X1M5W8_9ZZZZ